MTHTEHLKLEYDDPNLPVFVTRHTCPVSNDQRRADFDLLYPVFANLPTERKPD